MEKRGRGRPKKILEAAGGLMTVSMGNNISMGSSLAGNLSSFGLESPAAIHAPPMPIKCVLRITDQDITKFSGISVALTKSTPEPALAELPKQISEQLSEQEIVTKKIFRRSEIHQKINSFMNGRTGERWYDVGFCCCFYCGCPCPTDRPPIGIPESVDRDQIFSLYAPMCSVSCANSWLVNGGRTEIDQCSIEVLADRTQLFLMMLEKCGVNVLEVRPQHSPFLHSRYGGVLKDEDYWNDGNTNMRYDIFTNMVRPVGYFIEETGAKLRTHRG